MSNAVISLKVDEELKQEATLVAQRLGIPLATYLRMCLKKLRDEQQINFQRSEVPVARVHQRWKQQSEDIKKQKNLSPKFSSIEDFKADLQS